MIKNIKSSRRDSVFFQTFMSTINNHFNYLKPTKRMTYFFMWTISKLEVRYPLYVTPPPTQTDLFLDIKR